MSRKTGLLVTLFFSIPIFTVQLSAAPVRFVAMSDSRGSDTGVNSAILSQIVTAILKLSPKPVCVLFPGDLVETGSTAELTRWIQVISPLTQSGVTIYPVPGNHELVDTNGQDNFRTFFTLPTNGPPGYEELCYSFDYGNVHFVGLDSYAKINNIYYDRRVIQTQRDWLDQDLTISTQPYTFVFTHAPAYPVSNHVGNSLDAYPTERDAVWQILDKHQVNIYFCGHEHNYSRWKIDQKINSNWQNGVTQIVTGGAGAPLYRTVQKNPDLFIDKYNFCVVDVDGSTVTVKAYDETGSVIDYFLIYKSLNISDTSAPVISAVNVFNIGITSATISWQSDEPSTCQVEYGLTLNYTNKTFPELITGTTYTTILLNLSPNTTYFFRIKATDLANNIGYSFGYAFKTHTIASEQINSILSVSVTTLDFGEVKKGQTKTVPFYISNVGTGTLTGTVTSDQIWIKPDPDSFNQNNVMVKVTVDNRILNQKEGQYTGTITVTSNGGTTTVSVKLQATCVLVYPNPFSLKSGKVITFWGTGIVPYQTKIKIYTLGMDLVKILSEKAGMDTIRWDGTNETGEQVVPGIYFYTTESPTEKNAGRITVIK